MVSLDAETFFGVYSRDEYDESSGFYTDLAREYGESGINTARVFDAVVLGEKDYVGYGVKNITEDNPFLDSPLVVADLAVETMRNSAMSKLNYGDADVSKADLALHDELSGFCASFGVILSSLEESKRQVRNQGVLEFDFLEGLKGARDELRGYVGRQLPVLKLRGWIDREWEQGDQELWGE